MKLKHSLPVLFILFSLTSIAQQKKEWKQLFNGKNLDGWYQITDDKGNDKN